MFDEDGNFILNDAQAVTCPTDPDELNQCDGCS